MNYLIFDAEGTCECARIESFVDIQGLQAFASMDDGVSTEVQHYLKSISCSHITIILIMLSLNLFVLTIFSFLQRVQEWM